MKVLIIGAGVIGTIYGWAISEAGHDVVHVVRTGQASRLARGVAIDMFDKRRRHERRNMSHYDIKVVESLDASSYGFDMVIVPIHHYELVDTLKQFAPRAKNAGFVLLTQNWQGTAEVDSILPQNHYLYGDVKAGGAFRDDVLVATISTIDLGQASGRHDDCLTKGIDLFESADLKPRLRENIIHYLWVQYAIAGGLWPALVRAGSFETLLRDRHTSELALTAARECLDVVARRGVDLSKYPETRMYYKRSFILRQAAVMMMKFMFRHNEYAKRSSAHALANAREIKTFFYDLLNTGHQLHVDMPIMTSFQPDIEEFWLKATKRE